MPSPAVDRWALVTGASAGLGEEFARQLAGRGWNLVLTARREERLRALAGELSRQRGIGTAVVAADLADPEAPAALWTRATEGRRISLLVNNAGFGSRGLFHAVPLERQLEMVRLNCSALLELAHRAIVHMRAAGGGGIINVASVVAYQPVPTMATYGASKAFVRSLSAALHEENRDAGIAVLALCPGRVPTEFQAVSGSGTPDADAAGVLTPAEVVRAALAALEARRATLVPGVRNRVTTAAAQLLPSGLAARIARRVAEGQQPD